MARGGRWRNEKRIESNACARALAELQVANIPLKIALGAETGWPDRLFLLGNGKILFVEFKYPGEKPSAKQEYIHEFLRELGYEVQVHTNEDETLRAIRSAKVDSA